MRRLTMTTFLTLDGVMQAPGGPNEDPSGGFDKGGWLVPFADEDMGRFMNEVFANVDGFVLGRRTHDIFAAYWPQVDDSDPIARALNHLPKYVASTTLTGSDWHNTTVISRVPEQVADLKQQPGGELQVHGSGDLAQTLMRHDLIDVFHLLIYPVVLGAGRRLFREALPRSLRLVDSRTTSTGVAIHSYEPAGEPNFGSFELP